MSSRGETQYKDIGCPETKALKGVIVLLRQTLKVILVSKPIYTA